jgi:anti-sigma factor RsiW
MRSAAMACSDFVELVTEYVEGTLSPADRRRFDAHISECPGCRPYLDQMRQVIRATGRLAEDAIPERAKRALLRAFRDWRATSSG